MTLNAETPNGKSTKRSNEGADIHLVEIPKNNKVFPTITQAFLNKVQTRPDRKILFSKNGTHYEGMTWKQFHDNCRLLSLGLQSLGVKSTDRVCILSNTNREWMLTDMAILGARAITVPIYASTTPQDTAFIANHCEAGVIFVEDQKQLEKILGIREQLPLLKKIVVFTTMASKELAAHKDVLSLNALLELGGRYTKGLFDENLLAITPEDVFTICYTSGTTGTPKGVVLTFSNLNSLVEDIERVISKHVGENDIFLTFLPFSHIFGKVESMLTYHFGWQLYFAESIDKLFTNIGEVRPTILFAVPRIFEKAYNKIRAAAHEGSTAKRILFNWAFQAGREYYESIWDRKRPTTAQTLRFELARRLVLQKVYAKFGGRLRYCIAGGAPLPLEVAQFMQIIGMTILEGYGLTETCAPVTLNTPDAFKFGSIGKALPEVALKIAADGEILVKSQKVFKEYYKNPSATAEVLENGWFHTGDIGTIDSEGFVRITDRKKDLIVTSGGKNVAPQKIENLIKTQKYMNQAIVVGDNHNYLSALLTLEKDEVVKFAKENNILFSEYSELVKHDRVLAEIQRLINKVNKDLASYESIKRFTILPFEFTVDGGELTPSLKLKRRFCMEKYRSVIDELYGNPEAH